MRLLYFLVTASIVLTCCEPPVTFTEPTPVNGKTLDKFPKRYQGIYVNKDDGSRLYVGEYLMVREYDYDIKLHRDSLKEGDSLSGDTVYHLNSGELDIVELDGNYLRKHISYMDTIYSVNPSTVLKKYKGYLFLNSPGYYKGYEVKQLKLSKGILEVNAISTPEEIEMLNEFEENDSDTIASPYSPSKKEFRKFVRTEGFKEGEQFVRIK